jgi:hypothetical protein
MKKENKDLCKNVADKRGEDKLGATVEQLVKWYEDGVAYQTALGLRSSIPQCVRFYEGDQWEAPTKATKHFPRPVVNITEMICNNKKSQVLSSPIKIVYKSENDEAAIDKFNRFAEYEQGRLRQTETNSKACLDGIVKGSYCFYYFWDKECVGTDGLVEGDIGLQLLDPLSVIFANPNENDEQKQEWIMLVSREDVESIRKAADSGTDLTKICDDDSDSVYHEVESDTTKYATVLTRFFRNNGEVYFERATKAVLFMSSRALTPDVKSIKNAIEGKENEKEEHKPEEEFLKDKPKATLYPIVFSSWKSRDKSIYGRGEVEAIIPNQKAINWTLGLQILMAQNEGMSAVVVSPDALKGQTITNEPGQVLTDYSKTGNGIRPMNKQAMSQASVALVEKISDLTRVATSSSEVMSGEVISAGMSGAAIAQLQAQALKPIEDLQKGFWRSMEKAGEIYEQYLRFFFTGKKFQYKDKGDKILSDEFNSDEYKDTKFDVIAEAVAGTVMSDVADINILDGLYAKGAISLKTFITCYPQNAIANRQKLLESIEQEQQGVVEQLNAQLQQAQAQLEQAAAALQAQEKVIESAKQITDDNRNLKEKLIELQAEYLQKINQANQILIGLGKAAKEYHSDAKDFAGEIARKRGIKPQQQAAPTQGAQPQVNSSGQPL